MDHLTLTFHVTDSILRQFNAFLLPVLRSLLKIFLSRNTHNSSSVKSLKRSNLFLLRRKVHIGLEKRKKKNTFFAASTQDSHVITFIRSLIYLVQNIIPLLAWCELEQTVQTFCCLVHQLTVSSHISLSGNTHDLK